MPIYLRVVSLALIVIWVSLSYVFASQSAIAQTAQASASAYLSSFSGQYYGKPIIEDPNYQYSGLSVDVGVSFQLSGGTIVDKNNIAVALSFESVAGDVITGFSVNIPLSNMQVEYAKAYQFESSGFKGNLTFTQRHTNEFYWNEANVYLDHLGKSFKVAVSDLYFFANYFENCPLNTSFRQGEVGVHASNSALPNLVLQSFKQNWNFMDVDAPDKNGYPTLRKLRQNDFDCDNADSGTACVVHIVVGSGREFDAMKRLSNTKGVTCVSLLQRGGGSYYEALEEIPFGSLFDTIDSVQFAAVGAKVGGLVAGIISGAGAKISEPKQIGTETRFTISALLPNRVAKFSEKSGYWYYFGMTFSVDFDSFNGGLTESLNMSLNDVVEVKFPENSDRPPSNDIVKKDGKILLFSDIDNKITDDGRLMVAWTVWLLSEISKKIGGNVHSNSLDDVW